MMKKTLLYSLAIAMLLTSTTSCEVSDTRTYLGTMAGAEIGGTIGEAIGWMSTSRHDGPGKAMLGSVIGTVAGAAIGNSMAKNSKKAKKYGRKDDTINDYGYYNDNSSADYQTGGGYDNSYDTNRDMSNRHHATAGSLTIHNVTYQDEDGDGRFSRYETINVMYEVTNRSRYPQSVVLSIDDPSNAKNFAFSPANTVTINAGQTIRYKAKAFCKSRPKSGYTNIIVTASSGANATASSSIRIHCVK